MNKHKLAQFVHLFIGILFLTNASFALAITPIPRVTRPPELENVRTDLKKTNALAEIDRRLTALNRLIGKITTIKKISSQQKSVLTLQIQNEISSLNSLRTKIEADTDLATLRTDKKSIVSSYRIFALFMPRIEIIAHADSILVLIDELRSKLPAWQDRISFSKSAGQDTAMIQTKYDSIVEKLDQAEIKAKTAIDLVTPLTPEGFPANKTQLQNARSNLKSARIDLESVRAFLSALKLLENKK